MNAQIETLKNKGYSKIQTALKVFFYAFLLNIFLIFLHNVFKQNIVPTDVSLNMLVSSAIWLCPLSITLIATVLIGNQGEEDDMDFFEILDVLPFFVKLVISCMFMLVLSNMEYEELERLSISSQNADQGYFSPLMDKDEYMVPIAKLPDESLSTSKNEISVLVKAAIQDSFIRVMDIKQPITLKGKTTAKARCLVLDKPCWAYLMLSEKGKWEVVSITTK